MDPPPRDLKLFNSHLPDFSHRPRTTTNSRTGESNSSTLGRHGEMLRRGHSDGEVPPSGPGPQHRMPAEDTPGDGESWTGFLTLSSSTEHDAQGQGQNSTRRALIMAADRRRRHADHPEDPLRRRSASNQSFGYNIGGRKNHSVRQEAFDNPLVASASGVDGRPGHAITDRPLPRRPSNAMSGDREGQDNTLPPWQPDAEVSSCPICGTAFSFWYRKHHCRKCGRVVCASCSPHRITIPRQFIVHSPQESSLGLHHGTGTIIDFVDLTGDGADQVSPSHQPRNRDKRETQDYRIDPALGGGQEIRLCNPCVPDPNPSPHLRYPSPIRYRLESSSQTNKTSRRMNFPSAPSSTASNDQSPTSRSIVSANDRDTRQSSTSGFNSVQDLLPTGPYSPQELIGNRRHSHVSRPAGRVPQPPPNYQSTFGSVPDQLLHDRYIETLVQGRPSHSRHHHHHSMGNIGIHPRYRSTPDVNMPTPSRAASRPLIPEEDECPICHSALPPKGPDGSEEAREAHVTSCIESHFSNSIPRAPHRSPAVTTAAALAGSAAGPSQAGAVVQPALAADLPGSRGIPPSSSRPRRRTTGMVVYHANEKDCTGENGEGAQECVICFEEFAVGDEMGRLECLCKFHRLCIRQWWDTKGVGACPVHQGGL